MTEDKIAEIRARYAGYSLNSGNAGKANEDRGWLLAEVERLRADRRERIATAALNGLMANAVVAHTPDVLALAAVVIADALIAELDKEEGKP